MAQGTGAREDRRVRLNHATIRVSDLERSVAFYERLGLTRIVAAPGYARFACPEGDSTLSLSEAPGTHEEEACDEVSLHFESDRLDELVGELLGRGVEFELAATDQPYLWREAMLRDPDGHLLFLYHAGENRLHPPWRLPDSL